MKLNVFFITAVMLLFSLAACDPTTDTPGDNNGDNNNNNNTLTVTDQDGNTYQTVQIGRLTFMAENLRTTKLNDGTAIPEVTEATAWSSTTSAAYCYYNNQSSNASKGLLYNQYAYATGKLAPAGWHVATREDWDYVDSLCRARYTWDYLYALTSKTGWDVTSRDGSPGKVISTTNATNLNIIPTGRRTDQGVFELAGKVTGYWGEYHSIWQASAYLYEFYNDSTAMVFGTNDRNAGYPVRCVKD